MSSTITHDEWKAEGRRRFGEDNSQWRFVCPSCGHIATTQDWVDAGAPPGAVAYSCVGRWSSADGSNTFRKAGGPCNYAGGGLFGLNPITVLFPDGTKMDVFNFADDVALENEAA